MRLSLDPDYRKAIEWLLPELESETTPPIGDWATRRSSSDARVASLFERWPDVSDIEREVVTIKAQDGYDLPIHCLRKKCYDNIQQQETTPAVLYAHGGGFIFLSAEHYKKLVSHYVSHTGIPFFMPDYRFAPEHPYPTPLNDCYNALIWLSQNSRDLNIDASRIAVVGDSAGGNLAAALAIRARDEMLTPVLARQMIIGGMLDDRTTLKPQLDEVDKVATWNVGDNITGWREYIGKENVGTTTNQASTYAAPARVEDTVGLPCAYIDVSQLDILCEENVEYAARLSRSGVQMELHVWTGVPHSFEFFAFDIDTSRKAMQMRVDFLREL